MRIYQIPHPEGIDSLLQREAPTPKPGRGQVLVRMRAASLNYRDLMVLTGRYARGAPLADLVPLSDGAGEVADIGPDVTRVKPGDRVAGIFMQSWLGGDVEPADAGSSLGGAIHGVLAEYVVFRPAAGKGFQVERTGEGAFAVRGRGIERLLQRYDIENEDAMAYLEERLRRIGVLGALEAEGFEAGDELEVGGVTFELDPDAK